MSLPVTLVCGFLGAGKTTLVNHLLRCEPQGSVLVVENELGEDAIDGELLEAPRRDVVELAEGCLCCSLADGFLPLLVEAVRAHALRQGLRGGPPLRRVLVETTGVADPGPILRRLYAAGPAIEPLVIDGVICVVDARRALRTLDSEPVAARQIGAADVVVLNKADLVSEGELGEARRLVEAANPTARVESATNAVVDPALALDLGGIDELRIERLPPPSTLPDQPREAPASAHGLTAVSLREDGELDLHALNGWLEAVITQFGEDLVRIKGVLALAGRDRRLLLHGVHDQFDCRYSRPWEGVTRTNRLVLIGRDLPREALGEGLRSCLTTFVTH